MRWMTAHAAVWSLGLLSVVATPAWGQADGATTKTSPLPAKQTILSVELITGKDGAALPAQEWSQTFEKLGIAVRIRSQVLDEKPEIKEKQLGYTRMVTAVGRLDRNGRIVFPEKSFTQADSSKLKEYLDELTTYGSQGAPTGKPLWGLSEAQFGAIYAALGAKVEVEVEDMTLNEALARVGIPAKYPLRITTASKDWLASEYAEVPQVRHRVKGTSLGTALAIVLNGYGLGYRPLRTPAGTLELAIDPLKVTKDVWPIGWDPKQTFQKTAPKLFEIVPVDLEDVKFPDVLDAVAAKTNVPIQIDHYRIEGKGIKIDDIVVNVPPKKTTWSLLIKGIANSNKLTRRLRIDEQGQPFLWVTVLEPGRRDD